MIENQEVVPQSRSEDERRRETASTDLRKSDYLSVQPLIAWLREVAPSYASGTLLDYGCGNRPYLPLFQSRIAKYIGVDVAQNNTRTVDFVVPPEQPLPLSDSSVDAVLSTQVLEHTAEPLFYLREASRVLRPGGHLILTCPGTYMLHEEPYDYYRFTRYGIEYLLGKAGLHIVSLATAGGAWRVVGQTLVNHRVFGRKWNIPILSGISYHVGLVAVNILFSALDRWNTNRKEPSNYLVIARK